jgi:hypothetical protein
MNKSFVCASMKFALVVAWLVISSGFAVAASVVVMESSLAGLPRGMELADDQKLDIPPGDHVLVGIFQDGQLKQIDIKGPRGGSVKELLNPQSVSSKLWETFKRLLQTGGATEGNVAASRGVRLTLNDLPMHGDVTICLEDGSAPVLALASGSDGTSVRLSDNQGAQFATLNLPAGGSGVRWPTAVPLRDGEVYRVMEPSNPQVEVKVHLLPRGMLSNISAVPTLEALEADGCQQQLAIALRQVTTKQ